MSKWAFSRNGNCITVDLGTKKLKVEGSITAIYSPEFPT